MKRAWDAFSLHTGIGGVLIPLLVIAIGYVIGASNPTLTKVQGVVGGVVVASLWFLVVLLVLTPRTLWSEAQAKLAPHLCLEYAADRSLINEDGETHRLAIWNAGVTSIDDVWVRVVDVPTAPHLKGFLPMLLREQHSWGRGGGAPGAPFTLHDNARVYVDLIEYSESLSASLTTSGTQFILLCNDQRTHHGGIEHSGIHLFDVEVRGRNVPTCRKRFSAKSLLPERRDGDGATVEIMEIPTGG